MKPEKSPPMKMGKRGRLAMTLVWTAITLIWGVQVLQTMETGAPSNAPSWSAYALVTAGSALCAVCWLVSWLRYDKTHPKESKQDV